MGKRGTCVAATGLAVLALAAQGAGAAVVCQKGKRIKLRAEACKASETQIGSIGGGDPTGIWEFQSGTLFDVTGQDPRFLVLNGDGSGRLHLSGGDGGVITCGSFSYARGANAALTMDLESIGYLGTRVYPFALDGTAGLDLTDAGGRAASFTRATAVDPAADCGTLVQTGLFTGLPLPEFFSGLAFDGTSLWYEEQNTRQVFPVDPTTGLVGTPIRILAPPAAGAPWRTSCRPAPSSVTRSACAPSRSTPRARFSGCTARAYPARGGC
jgi:hypothetical protein